MLASGAHLVRLALEQLGIRFTFGIPGVHNTELFDELDQSEQIRPVLVTHEQGAAFMADAVGRSAAGVGCLTIVPGAGLTHAASGICEAFVDGVPMLVITGGIRRESGRAYQLHDIDQGPLASSISRGYLRADSHASVVPTIYEAFERATAGSGGPVVVEIPFEVMTFKRDVPSIPLWNPHQTAAQLDANLVKDAAQRLRKAERPVLFVGWGARGCHEELMALAETLGAPVATTLQGLASFPGSHPLSVGFGFGPAAVPAARRAFQGHDCMVAVGTRFAELSTGSYSAQVTENLIHVDVDESVFSRNYPAALAIQCEAKPFLRALQIELSQSSAADWKANVERRRTSQADLIGKEKAKLAKDWREGHLEGRVNPWRFFDALRGQLPRDGFIVTDDGNHTFLTAELFPITAPNRFLSPTDFNCMGYAVPAAVAAKLAHPTSDVVAIVGDGAFLMTGTELLTASREGIGLVCCVFRDGELGQIAQFQQKAYNRKSCSVLGPLDLEGFARGVGAKYAAIERNEDCEHVLEEALRTSREGQPILINVAIDYSRPTSITRGVSKSTLLRMPWGDRLRFVGRALARRL